MHVRCFKGLGTTLNTSTRVQVMMPYLSAFSLAGCSHAEVTSRYSANYLIQLRVDSLITVN